MQLYIALCDPDSLHSILTVISYQNATILSTEPTLSLTNVTGVSNGGRYFLAAINDAGFEIVVMNLYVLPAFLSQPKDIFTEFGSNVSLSVFIDGSPYPNIQWQKLMENGVFENVPGENAAIILFHPISYQDAGVYRCVISLAFDGQTYNGTSREAIVAG